MNVYVHSVNKISQKNIEIELKLLNEISRTKEHSQRSISKNLDVALGLANAIIKKFVKKGFLKLKQAPMKRYFYYLTPKGLVEKAKLTKEFLESSLEFYTKARKDYEELFKILKSSKKKIIFAGKSELTEIAILASKMQNANVEFIYSPEIKEKNFCGLNVINDLDKKKLKKSNTCFVLTEFSNTKDIYKKLKKNFDVYNPKFLIIE